MSPKSRITLSITPEGTLEMFLNEEGRNQLVKELRHLSETSDHFHLGPDDGWEVEVRTKPYKPDDKVIEYAKVLFRPDSWDKQYYPHVLDD